MGVYEYLPVGVDPEAVMKFMHIMTRVRACVRLRG